MPAQEEKVKSSAGAAPAGAADAGGAPAADASIDSMVKDLKEQAAGLEKEIKAAIGKN